MKKEFILIAFLTLFAFPASNLAQVKLCQVYPSLRAAPTETKKFGDVQYDYFGNPGRENVQLTYENKLFEKSTKTTCHSLNFQFRFYTPGKKITVPENVSLYFSSVSNALRYSAASNHKIKIIADGKEIYKADLDYYSTEYYQRKSYGENLSTEFDFTTFETLAKAKEISLVLGKTVFELSQNQIKSLEKMYSLVEK